MSPPLISIISDCRLLINAALLGRKAVYTVSWALDSFPCNPSEWISLELASPQNLTPAGIY